jgi:hypothetical protein
VFEAEVTVALLESMISTMWLQVPWPDDTWYVSSVSASDGGGAVRATDPGDDVRIGLLVSGKLKHTHPLLST